MRSLLKKFRRTAQFFRYYFYFRQITFRHSDAVELALIWAKSKPISPAQTYQKARSPT